MALLVAGVRAGDRVIVPTLTFIATANAVRHAGAEPVFVDCDEFMNIDVDGVGSFLAEACEPSDGGCIERASGARRAGRAAGPRLRPAGRPRGARVRGGRTRPGRDRRRDRGAGQPLDRGGPRGPLGGDGGPERRPLVQRQQDRDLRRRRRLRHLRRRRRRPRAPPHDPGQGRYAAFRRTTKSAGTSGLPTWRRPSAWHSSNSSTGSSPPSAPPTISTGELLADMPGIELLGFQAGTEHNYWFHSVLVDETAFGSRPGRAHGGPGRSRASRHARCGACSTSKPRLPTARPGMSNGRTGSGGACSTCPARATSGPATSNGSPRRSAPRGRTV